MIALAVLLSSAALAPVSDPAPLEAGRYGLFLEYAIAADVPVIGQTTSITTTTAIVDVAGDQSATQRVCSVSSIARDPLTGKGLGIETHASPALLKGIPAIRYRFQVSGGDITADLGSGALGYDDTKMKAGDLPTSSRDRAITDPDGDGVPGASINVTVPGIGNINISIVSKGRTKLRGQFVDAGVVGGKATLEEPAQRIVGGLPFAPPAQEVRADPHRSRFVLKKVDDNAGCSTVNQTIRTADIRLQKENRG